MMKFNSDFRHDLEFGQLGENHIAEILKGGDKVEVKSERDQWAKTGNMFVEFSSRKHPSGIATTEADTWAICFFIGKELSFSFITSVDKLKKHIKDGIENKDFRKVDGGDNDTSKGVLVPIESLRNIR